MTSMAFFVFLFSHFLFSPIDQGFDRGCTLGITTEIPLYLSVWDWMNPWFSTSLRYPTADFEGTEDEEAD